MGEKDGGKNEGEKAADKKDDGKITAVYKVDMHCEGCAKKIKRAVRSFDGVDDVKADCSANKLTVMGKLDPSGIREKLEQKIKKKVELVSPQPKKDGGGDNKPKEEPKKEEKKKDEKKPEKPKESTLVLKIPLHCDGCIHKMRKIIQKFDGVEKVDIDAGKDLVTVKGTMDAKALVPYLTAKLKRSVDVVPPKKDEGGDKKPKEGGGGGDGDKKKEGGGGGGDKKEKEGGGGGDKKEKEGGGGDAAKKEEGGGAKVELSKMEYHGYPYASPTYWNGGNVYDQNYPVEVHHAQNYPVEAYQGYVNHGYGNEGYVNQGYAHQGYELPHPHAHAMHAPQMFSDENPNACSVM
ncbi:heavy metal-associated isoprenylated plant protein 5-like [Corylus avellana]|uniref:heavy metal-associated isoprenylated plant protein 5-like n=1 Tax=Corylus avellana TaxID=13451 RepID=UPI001E230DD3|nr:heavy metal-associated isoprenylated plant protein 5-like [Corylus avellana]